MTPGFGVCFLSNSITRDATFLLQICFVVLRTSCCSSIARGASVSSSLGILAAPFFLLRFFFCSCHPPSNCHANTSRWNPESILGSAAERQQQGSRAASITIERRPSCSPEAAIIDGEDCRGGSGRSIHRVQRWTWRIREFWRESVAPNRAHAPAAIPQLMREEDAASSCAGSLYGDHDGASSSSHLPFAASTAYLTSEFKYSLSQDVELYNTPRKGPKLEAEADDYLHEQPAEALPREGRARYLTETAAFRGSKYAKGRFCNVFALAFIGAALLGIFLGELRSLSEGSAMIADLVPRQPFPSRPFGSREDRQNRLPPLLETAARAF